MILLKHWKWFHRLFQPKEWIVLEDKFDRISLMPKGSEKDLALCELFKDYEQQCFNCMEKMSNSRDAEYWVDFYQHYADIYHSLYLGVEGYINKKKLDNEKGI